MCSSKLSLPQATFTKGTDLFLSCLTFLSMILIGGRSKVRSSLNCMLFRLKKVTRVEVVFSQLRDIENIVKVQQLGWKCYLVGNCPYLFQNLEKTKKMRAQLFDSNGSTYTYCRSDFQKYVFSFLELDQFSPFVCITFLTALCNENPLPYPLYLLSGLPNQIRS